MARTGTFGRAPRAQPSLTATLVAIAREMQNQRDRNIMDAWEKGGMFEGAPVTDDRILKYWRGRLKGISKDDPLYDTYRMAVTQFEYVIAESKMTARYAMNPDPSAGDDAAMARFYLNWARKIPKDSEFYRRLQRDAGQYLRSAKAKRDAASKRDLELRYREQQETIAKGQSGGKLALDVLSQIAQQGVGGGKAWGGGPLVGRTESGAGVPGGYSREALGKMPLGSMDDIISYLGVLTVPEEHRLAGTGGPAGLGNRPTTSVVYVDPLTQQPVTGVDIFEMFRASDPDFNGVLDVKYIAKKLGEQAEALRKAAALAQRTGHLADMAEYNTELWRVNETARQVNAYPVVAEYSALKEQEEAIVSNHTLLPSAKLQALANIRMQIGTLAEDPRIAHDPRMQGQLRDEARGKEGAISLEEDITGAQTGLQAGQDPLRSVIGSTNAVIEQLTNDVELVSDPESGYVWTQGEFVADATTGEVRLVVRPGGPHIGAAPLTEVQSAQGAGPPVTTLLPNGDGKGSTPVVLVPSPIYAGGTKPDGKPIDVYPQSPIGGFLRYNVGGQEVILYGTQVKQGQTAGTWLWSTDPWGASGPGSGVDWSIDSKGQMHADMTDVMKTMSLTNPPPGFSVTTNTSGVQRVVMDPTVAVIATDPAHAHAGPDPYTDSFSPLLLAYKALPDGAALLAKEAQTPEFKRILEEHARTSAGQTKQVAPDGTVTWAGGDPRTLERNLRSVQIEEQLLTGGSVYTDRQYALDRTTNAPGERVAGKQAVNYVTDEHGNLVPREVAAVTPAPAMGGQPGFFDLDRQRTWSSSELVDPNMGAAVLPSITLPNVKLPAPTMPNVSVGPTQPPPAPTKTYAPPPIIGSSGEPVGPGHRL